MVVSSSISFWFIFFFFAFVSFAFVQILPSHNVSCLLLDIWSVSFFFCLPMFVLCSQWVVKWKWKSVQKAPALQKSKMKRRKNKSNNKTNLLNFNHFSFSFSFYFFFIYLKIKWPNSNNILEIEAKQRTSEYQNKHKVMNERQTEEKYERKERKKKLF